MNKTNKKKKPDVADEIAFLKVLETALDFCPPQLLATVILFRADKGPFVIGTCCKLCTAASIHAAADVIEDTRDRDHPTEGSMH